MRYSAFGFGGRPPLRPFARAASAFAALVAFPPLRPSETAAGFLRRIVAPLERFHRIRAHGARARLRFGDLLERVMADPHVVVRVGVRQGADGMPGVCAVGVDRDEAAIAASVQSVVHALQYTEPLGFCQVVVAALFVARDGPYAGVANVDAWDASRDARTYAGPYPVVAHPPCDRWCQMAPVNQARYGHRVGDDGGCFASALDSVRRWGGVLEHPALTLAWRAFGLPRPRAAGGWSRTFCGGWVAHVEQRHYGHRARKATWLYVFGLTPPILIWGPGAPPDAWISADRPRAELARRGIAQLGKREAKATPLPFRDLLLGIARSAAAVDPHVGITTS